MLSRCSHQGMSLWRADHWKLFTQGNWWKFERIYGWYTEKMMQSWRRYKERTGVEIRGSILKEF